MSLVERAWVALKERAAGRDPRWLHRAIKLLGEILDEATTDFAAAEAGLEDFRNGVICR